MRKLIEFKRQENIVVCDNPQCDYKIPNSNPEEWVRNYYDYLNMECPECGENLLTEEDYKTILRFIKTVNFINKWFSWLTLFSRKSTSEKISKVKIYKGVCIKDEE